MPELMFIGALALAGLTAVVALRSAPNWSIKARIHARLNHRRVALVDESEEAGGDFVFWLVDQKLFASDFQELEPYLDATGRSATASRRYYLAWCWALPIAIALIAFTRLEFVSAALGLLGAFYLPRRFIRTAGASAEKMQNREAIELCQLTRMLMEAGLSPERSLRLISNQARDIMPRLIRRIDRFNRVMESGAERSAALDELGRNRNLTVLRSYVALMKQSGTLGSKVASGLDQIVQEAQHEERSKLKEETNRIGARMTVIMMLFMLPSLFMLIGGPAVLSILDAFQR